MPSVGRSAESAALSPDLSGKVALVTGSSRGIGRAIALKLAACGCDIAVAAKSATPQPTLPGTIHTVAEEVRALGRKSVAVQCDVRDDAQVENMVQETVSKLGRLDILVCNSGALWWKTVDNTPMSKYDLVNNINVRAVFSCVRAALPHMRANGFGRIIVMSPPIDLGWLRQGGKVAYLISKFGMTMVAHGMARELRGTGVSINALWPATFIESFATKNFKMSERRQWRKADIIADSVAGMVTESADSFNGRAIIDEDYLRTVGVHDFSRYRCVPDFEPVKVWPVPDGTGVGGGLASEVGSRAGVPPGIQSRM